MWHTHRVFSEHRLLVTLSFFWPDRIVQLLGLKLILILILYLLVSIDLVYTGICEVRNCSGEEQLLAKLILFCSALQ